MTGSIGDSITREDLHVSTSLVATAKASAFTNHHPTERINIGYLMNSSIRLRDSFRRTGAIFTNSDGVQLARKNWHCQFVAALHGAGDLSVFGAVPPPMQVHANLLDFGQRSLEHRLEAASKTPLDRVPKPSADCLMSTYEVIAAKLHGIERFIHEDVAMLKASRSAKPLPSAIRGVGLNSVKEPSGWTKWLQPAATLMLQSRCNTCPRHHYEMAPLSKCGWT